MNIVKENNSNLTALLKVQITKEDYLHFDYIIPMDRKNMMSLTAWKPTDYNGEINLFMNYHADNLGETQIPDPYHDGPEKFIPIISIIEERFIIIIIIICKKEFISC